MYNEEEMEGMSPDLQETIIANIFWLILFGVVSAFFFSGMAYLRTIEDDILMMMALIFILFFTMKMAFWMGKPKLILTKRDKTDRLKILRKKLIHGY